MLYIHSSSFLLRKTTQMAFCVVTWSHNKVKSVSYMTDKNVCNICCVCIYFVRQPLLDSKSLCLDIRFVFDGLGLKMLLVFDVSSFFAFLVFRQIIAFMLSKHSEIHYTV